SLPSVSPKESLKRRLFLHSLFLKYRFLNTKQDMNAAFYHIIIHGASYETIKGNVFLLLSTLCLYRTGAASKYQSL
ncbi:hypothetical protein, partial [Streptococcus mutans]|uniref:hypothetical protein n=2 Tax=Streptococcus mutans TaxID=1309 RepID=UPI001ED9A700